MRLAISEFVQNGAAKRRFTGSNFTCDLNKTLPGFNSIKQAGKSIEVFSAEENKSWIWRYIERSFS